jgi:shikimate dehydrogenase
VSNRTLDKAREIADAVGSVVKIVQWEQREDALDGIAMLANATRLGSAGKPPLEMSLDRLPKAALVGDLIYVPPETPLLADARVRGNITVNGLGLLLNQARPAFNAWFGVMPEITPALRQALAATF